VLALGAAILLTAGCKRSEQAAAAASASASAAVIATSAPLTEEVYEDEPAASAAADGGTESRPRRHAPAATKRRPEPVSAARLFDDYGFPVLSAIEHLCGRREYPVSRVHLTWDAFASDIPPGELVDRYKRRIGEWLFAQGRRRRLESAGGRADRAHAGGAGGGCQGTASGVRRKAGTGR
jgi:hypothetical protein